MARRSISSEKLRALLRWDISWKDLWGDETPTRKVRIADYHPVWDDVHALLDNIRKRNPSMAQLRDGWGGLFHGMSEIPTDVIICDGPPIEELYDHIIYDEDDDMDMSDDGIRSDSAAMSRIVDAMYLIAASGGEERADSGIIDWKRLLADLDDFEHGRYDRFNSGWKWTDRTKIDALETVMHPGFSIFISEEEMPEARQVLGELCARNIPEAMEMMAYATYGGSELMPCDWKLSRKMLLTLMGMADVDESSKGAYANTLGYIYYYGRCSDGVPDYDAALKYFTVGAALGVIESQYKIADMLRGGKGVPRNKEAADTLVSEVYDKARKLYLESSDGADSNYPDAALRMAAVLEGKDQIYDAYRTLREGRIALDERDNYGDDGVRTSLDEEIERIEKEYPIMFSPQGEANDAEVVFHPLGQLVENGIPVKGEVVENGKRYIIGFHPAWGYRRVFIVLPGYDSVTDDVVYSFDDPDNVHVKRNADNFIFDTFSVDPLETDEKGTRCTVVFSRDGRETARVENAHVGIMIPPDMVRA